MSTIAFCFLLVSKSVLASSRRFKYMQLCFLTPAPFLTAAGTIAAST